MGVVRRAVEGIDDPRVIRPGHPTDAFLAEDRVARERIADDVEDRRLRRDVGPRDDRRPLALELDLLRSLQPFDQHRTAGPGGGDRDLEVVVDVLHSGQHPRRRLARRLGSMFATGQRRVG